MSDTYKGSKILLVEDEETLAVGLEYNLTEEDYLFKWAKNGREAVEFYESEKFDLVILDIMLPYIDGFKIAERIRSSDPQMPILMPRKSSAPTHISFGFCQKSARTV